MKHVFEEAGLGKAPFRLIGIEVRRGPIPVPGQPGMTVGAPGQPMGSCKYCGNGIAECCIIQSADGKVFEVGNVCVGKTGDAGLRKAANREKRKLTNARSDERIAAAYAVLDDSAELRDTFRAQPHPTMDDRTMLDYFAWMRQHAGRAGNLKVARKVEQEDK